MSPAEAQLLREITSGRTLAESASHLGRALNTVRNQLQSIFAKTQTHRQAELVAKVLKRFV